MLKNKFFRFFLISSLLFGLSILGHHYHDSHQEGHKQSCEACRNVSNGDSNSVIYAADFLSENHLTQEAFQISEPFLYPYSTYYFIPDSRGPPSVS